MAEKGNYLRTLWGEGPERALRGTGGAGPAGLIVFLFSIFACKVAGAGNARRKI